MKKQFLLLIVINLAGVCFSSLKDNSVKACGSNKAACSVMKKNAEYKLQTNYVEDVDASFNIFMIPYIY